MGEPDAEKFVNFVDIDYVGQGTLKVYADDDTLILDSSTTPSLTLNSTTRRRERLYIHTDKRYSTDKVKFYIETTDHDFILYDVEIDFEVHKRSGEFYAQSNT